MSWIDIVAERGLNPPTPVISLDIFRVVVAGACLFKFGLEHMRHAMNYFDETNFVRYVHERRGYGIRLSRRMYRALYVMKFAAATLLLLGVVPRVAAIGVAAWLFLELGFDHKYHTTFLALAAALLSLEPCLGHALNLMTLVHGFSQGWGPTLRQVSAVEGTYWPQLLIVILVTQMYWSSAVWKLRSRPFRSGVVLHQMSSYMFFEHRRWLHREVWYPPVLARSIATRRLTPSVWAVPSMIVVALEFVQPGLLIVNPWPTAFVVGALMHAGFTWLLPARLVPFSVATVGSYVLFIDPWQLSHAIAILA